MPVARIFRPLCAALGLVAATGTTHAGLVLADAGAPFAQTAVGAVSPPRDMVWRNSGRDALRLGEVRLAAPGSAQCGEPAPGTCGHFPAADFFIAADACSGQELAPGASCTVRLHFAPNSEGERLAVLMVGDPSGAGEAHANLHGTGAAGSASLDALGCVLNWAERMYPDLLTAGAPTRSAAFLRARCYAGDTLCLGAEVTQAGERNPEVYVFHAAGSPSLQALGPFSTWAAAAQCAGTDGPIDITLFERPYLPQDGRGPPPDWALLAQHPFTVIRSAEGLAAAWADAHRPLSGRPAPPLPAVDFARHMVIGATDAGCRSRTIQRIRQNGQELVVLLQPAETPPGRACADFPHSDFVLVPRTALLVRFDGVDPRWVREW